MLFYMKIKTLVQNVFLKKTVPGPDCFIYDRLVMNIICKIFSLKFYLQNKSKKMKFSFVHLHSLWPWFTQNVIVGHGKMLEIYYRIFHNNASNYSVILIDPV